MKFFSFLEGPCLVGDSHLFNLKTSFTAFGVEKDTGNLILISVFAGEPSESRDNITFFEAEQEQGITLNQMATLMIELGASDAIAGGGSADTQQCINKHSVWMGPPHYQPDRPQVKYRGLGAVFALLVN